MWEFASDRLTIGLSCLHPPASRTGERSGLGQTNLFTVFRWLSTWAQKDSVMTQIDPKTRRTFLKFAGTATAAATAVSFPAMVFADAPKAGATPEASTAPVDTPAQIFTAALIAEDLATTFYYNGLIGDVITNVNLSGPGGSATSFTSKSNFQNVFYLRAALAQEMAHAGLLRTLLGLSASATADPNQSFFFDPATFSDFAKFTTTLVTLEQAFIGAYMAAIKEFVLYAAAGQPVTVGSTTYQPSDFALFAKITSTILGVECEHRALARVISNSNPADNFNYEQSSGIATVFNGSNSAAAKLGPFLSAGSGTQSYSLQTALGAAATVTIASYGSYPAS